MSNIQVINELKELGQAINDRKGVVELRFNCPFCIDVRGKSDDDAKLYFNRKKNTGFCFKCHTVVILKQDLPKYSLHDAFLKLRDKFLDIFSQKRIEKAIDQLKLYDISHLPKVRKGTPEFTYLLSREGFKEEYIEQYFLKTVLGKKKGIVIPSEKGNRITYYQIRYLPGYSSIKYKSPTSIKPLFFLLQEYRKSSLVICEGAFDAMAMSSEEAGAVACLGTYLSPYQLFQLRFFFADRRLKNVTICLDSDAINKAGRMYRQVFELGIADNIFIGVPPKGKDPAEANGNVSILHPLQASLLAKQCG